MDTGGTYEMKRKTGFGQLRKVKFLLGILLWSVILLTGTVSASARVKSFNQSSSITITDENANFDFSRRSWKRNKYTWIKYKAPENGYVTITANWKSKYKYSEGFWRLYKSNKRTALSKSVSYCSGYNGSTNRGGSSRIYERQSTFGVKKGTTYYLRLQSYNGVRLTCKFKTVKEKCGKKRNKKTPALKKNKTVKGIILPNDKNKDWYKITFKKPQYVRLYYNVKSDGKFKITFCSIIGSKMWGTKSNYTTKTRGVMLFSKNPITKKKAKLNAGTYYVKVEPADKYSSGYYSLKWK